MEVCTFEEIELSGVKGVLIDLDNTLYDFGTPNKKALEICSAWASRSFALSGVTFYALLEEHRAKVVQRLHPQGACRSRFLWFESLFRGLGAERAHELAAEVDTLYWESFFDHMQVDGGALDFLRKCSAKKVPVCIVTDMTSITQVAKMRRLGIAELISYCVTSEEAGAEKPDARMFSLGMEKIGVDAGECIMIGDNYEKDIVGAERCGVRSYHLNRASSLAVEYK